MKSDDHCGGATVQKVYEDLGSPGEALVTMTMDPGMRLRGSFCIKQNLAAIFG